MRKILRKKFILIYNSHNVESEYSKIISKSKNIPKIVYLLYNLYINILEKLTVNLSDYIISVSEENKKTLSKKDSMLVETIDQVQKYEKRLENLERDIKNLDSRYRSGRISPKSYYNSRKGLVNRLKDIIKKMEELLENVV